MKKIFAAFCLLIAFTACNSPKNNAPTIGFVDAFEDNTIAQSRKGFMDALDKNGFSEKQKTLNVLYRNAQGSSPTLLQIISYMKSQKVKLVATCPSSSTIAAVQNIKDIPLFMMVAPTPAIMKVEDAQRQAPANLFGVADNINYIDTSFALIHQLIKPKAGKLRVGMIYNQSESQSVDAFNRINELAKQLETELVALPLNSSADAQLVTKSLLTKNIDVFFANPDNTVFAAFETIVKACNMAKVPIFTSEAGLVERGAVAAYGADLYQWGYQSGEQAAQYLKTNSTNGLHWQMVAVRKRVYNVKAATQFGIAIPANFEQID